MSFLKRKGNLTWGKYEVVKTQKPFLKPHFQARSYPSASASKSQEHSFNKHALLKSGDYTESGAFVSHLSWITPLTV